MLDLRQFNSGRKKKKEEIYFVETFEPYFCPICGDELNEFYCPSCDR